MNKKYFCIDGKAVVKDENENCVVLNYYDNLDEVLIKENVIETIEKKIEELEEENLKNSKRDSKRKKRKYFPWLLIYGLVMTNIVITLFHFDDTQMMATIFGLISEKSIAAISLNVLMLPILSFLELIVYREYKHQRNSANAVESELKYLKRVLEKEREALAEMKKSDEKQDNNDFYVVKIDDKNELDKLERTATLYSNLGYDFNKYYKLYQRGILDRELQKYCDESDAHYAKEYIEEKGKKLVKVRKK